MDGMGPHIGSGALKVIGVIGPKRSPALSGVASLFEQAATDAAFATPGRAGLIKQSGITLD